MGGWVVSGLGDFSCPLLLILRLWTIEEYEGTTKNLMKDLFIFNSNQIFDDVTCMK